MDIKENLKGYYAAVTAMDSDVGRIVAEIEAAGLLENTLFCFLSDNGFNCGHHGIWGKGNGTFPVNMYDTSVKVPVIMSLPGRISEDAVNTDLLSGYDFLPTLLDIVGLENPAAERLPGKSFAPALEGKPLNKREGIVVFDEYGPVRMIRTKRWKYVHRYQFGPHELYDLENDPEERYNRVRYPDYQEVVRDLRLRLDDWFCRYVDPSLDGARLPVTGKGQINLVGPRGEGEEAFYGYDVVNTPSVVSLWEPNNPGGK
jgi:arylsulfatase A-like enzyme